VFRQRVRRYRPRSARRSASGIVEDRRLVLASLFVALACLGPGAPLLMAQAPQTASDSEVRSATEMAPSMSVKLRTGDAVRMLVWRQPDFSGEFTVLPDGSLAHPLLRDAKVSDVQFQDALRRMRSVLQRYDADPQFVAEPLVRVTVGGEVVRGARYYLPPETDVAQAVAEAGGITDMGRRDRVRLFRGTEAYVFDLGSTESGADRVLIQSGDQILVDRRNTVGRDIVQPVAAVIGATASIISLILIAGGK
jgi:protein involved in polysaccharide export with SLBB domain